MSRPGRNLLRANETQDPPSTGELGNPTPPEPPPSGGRRALRGAQAVLGAIGVVLGRAKAFCRRMCEKRPIGVHLLTAWARFSDAEGGKQAAAVTYFGFLSFFPLVALAFAALGFVVEWFPHVYGDLTTEISRALPGLVGNQPGQVNVGQIADAREGAGAIGVAGLVWAGTGWIDALRQAVRQIWGHGSHEDTNFLLRRLRDFGVLALLGGAMLLSVGLSTVGTIATGRVVGGLGFTGNEFVQWLIRAAALGIAVLGSTALFAVMFVGMSGTHIPRRELRRGALLAAVGYEVLKIFATLLLGHTVRNPVYATFSVAVGLLVWINLVTRMTLFAAAWTATYPPDVASGAAGELI
ncbi:MAG TPA: YhjD/YihY/BrkB family envelope integrity protein [Sporichthyaceae bacterium]|nr:YhjD/YihY/BrkB family envelope integrity protein [Sporichthyaceae bacterium]